MAGGVLAQMLVATERYTAPGNVFSGSTVYLSRGADLTGNADSKVGTFSCWIKYNSIAAAQTIYDGQGDIPEFRINTSGAVIFDFYNSAITNILRMNTSNLGTGTWRNILASWDLAAGATHLYVNDVSDKTISIGPTNDTIDYTRTNHWIGTRSGSSQFLTSDLADVYINFATYIDLSTTANRRKFINSAGKPEYLGPTGALPTGTAPIMYFQGTITDFATNKGTGGGFTTTGALTNAATSPSY